jgi:hypothetical protein
LTKTEIIVSFMVIMDNSVISPKDDRGPKIGRPLPDLSKLSESLRTIVTGGSKYDPDTHIPLAHEQALKGLTNDMIAARLGIAVGTFRTWIGTQEREGWYPELREAVLSGQRLYDAKMIEVIDGIITGRTRTLDGEVDVKSMLKAAEFWLSRRNRSEFAESQTFDITTSEASDPAAAVWDKIKAKRQAEAKREADRAKNSLQEAINAATR